MSNNTECAAFFKGQAAYQRCFLELRKKWRSYGKVAGSITLRETTEEERRAIGGIIGKVFYEKDIRFSFAEFEQGLQKTRFSPVDMREVLEQYFGETLSTNQGEKQEEQKHKKAFLEELCACFQEEPAGAAALLWLNRLIAAKKHGYQLLMREYAKDPKQAKTLAKNVGNALVRLARENGEKEYPLAVFAAEMSGNPHYFDRGTAAGALLVHALSCCRERQVPDSAHQWRELLIGVGLIPDNVSSMVHVYGLRLQTKDGWHPAYDAFCSLREPYVITMENLRGITGVHAQGDRVYIVENEMVFCSLLEHAKAEKLTLLCTSGQLRTAALELIPLILDSGADISYSGDIDPDGIGIADRLWQKFGNRIHMWRMSSADYAKSLSNEEIGDSGISKLENIKNPILKETADQLKIKRKAGYQENLLEDLQKDIDGFLSGIWRSYENKDCFI